MIRLSIQRVQRVPPMPQTSIVIPNVKLSIALHLITSKNDNE